MADATDSTESIASYSFLPRLGGAGVQLELTSTGVNWTMGVRTGHLAFQDVTRVHLVFQPAKFATASFEMRVEGRGGERILVSSASRVALTRVETQGPAYLAFVEAFHRAVGATGIPVEWKAGYGRLRWWLMAGLGVLTLLALLVVLGLTLSEGQWIFSGLLVLFSAVLIWPMAEALWRNQPSDYEPSKPPVRLLPHSGPSALMLTHN